VNHRPCGDLALRVEVAELAVAHRLAGLARRWPEVADAVPAPGTVLLVAVDPAGLARLARRLARLDPSEPDPSPPDLAAPDLAAPDLAEPGLAAPDHPRPRRHELPTVYDGADLADFADRCGLTVAEVIARHAGADYRVDFLGFAPGFGYLSGLQPALKLPRRDTPRTRVPAGSVAVAEGWTAVYPTESAGGWWLLGRTETPLFDPQRDPPARFAAGDQVNFRALL
jgi:KipI family sensor histidine kinase inhibitor